MKLSDILVESADDTDTIFRLITNGTVDIPRDPETGMPSLSTPMDWKDFFEGENDYGVDLNAVDWGLVHRDFYV